MKSRGGKRKAKTLWVRDAKCCCTCRYCLAIVPAFETNVQYYCRKRTGDTTLGRYVLGHGRRTMFWWVCDFWRMKA